ncbi:hypothetical protein M514_04596 [Trichuris suis]|uniref:Uncharacterized protein n=1 Tax=Trichuris suis TaxID=68888 RepID=A0A085NV16_9BILA|nr:hypothetical protein M514_04596 [Trichuris suis]
MRGPGKNEAERFFFSVHRAVGALRVKGAEGELRCRAALQTERCNTVGRRDVTSSVRRCQRCYTSTADSKNSSPQTFVLTNREAAEGSPRTESCRDMPFGCYLIPALHPQAQGSLIVNHIARSPSEEQLISIVQKSWSLEIVSVKRMDMEILSAEEKQALGILQSSLRKVDGHYECKLLWRRPV